MDDPWGNAWSAPSKDEQEDPKKPFDAPKWTTFERDADENTVDVGVPSWTAASGVGWGDGPSNLWHAESADSGAWSTNDASHEAEAEEEPEPEDEAAEEESEDGKNLAPRTILPTPPQSPLPLPSPPAATPPIEEIPPASPPHSMTAPASPDPFGSFESAENVDEEPDQPSSWTPNFPSEATDEPWGAAWGGKDTEDGEDEGNDEALNDEWELAQQARRKRDRKVPPELLGSLVTQWDDFAKELYPDTNPDDNKSQSWRKGMDNVEGLTELVDTLLPVASFPPPVQFSKTAVAKAVKESLRLTRSYSLTRSSPMAHLYASKGSNDWERSVKAQKTAANDEWGWDLKHEPEEKSEPADSAKDKRGGGLLSFWGRKASSNPSTPAADSSAPNQPKSPTATSKPASPVTSARPSIDASGTATSSRITSPTPVPTPVSPIAIAEAESATGDGSAIQPSAVSRFFNRFSRKPSAPAATSERENRRSLALSANDLSFLSDMAPSTSEGSSLSHRGTDSVGSLEAMLSSPPPGPRYSSPSSSKLPPPLAPPPPSSSCSPGPTSAVSQASDASFDAKMAEAQLMDLLVDMGPSSSTGYAPVSFDLIDAPAESKPLSSALSSPALPSPMHPPLAPFPRPQPSVMPSGSDAQRFSQLGSPTLSTVLSPPPPPPPMVTHSSASPRGDLQRSSNLPSTSPPPLPPPRSPANVSMRPSSIHRLDSPLPPPPKNDFDDFSDFFSASRPSAHPRPQPGPSSPSPILSPTIPKLVPPMSNQSLYTQFKGADNSADFGDFGDFISTPVRTPSPPKVPRKTSRAANHKPTIELLENAASRPGRWPAPASPLPQPLAPPPGLASGVGYFNKPSIQQTQQDFLSNDSPMKSPPPSGVLSPPGQTAALPPPLFAGPPSRPASTSLPGFRGPSPAASTSRSSTPVPSPFSGAPPKPPAKSGLSAQDLSFFEGL